jgi:hypothetical protein
MTQRMLREAETRTLATWAMRIEPVARAGAFDENWKFSLGKAIINRMQIPVKS